MIETSPSVEANVALANPDSLTKAQLALVTIGRLVLVTAFRIIYPLQPFLALQLNVDLRTVSALVTIQSFATMISPLGGILADLRGERTAMGLGLALLCAGALLCAQATTFGFFLMGYGLIGLAVALYQPSAQSYLSARTSYARRGRSLGILETSWAGAALIGVAPLMLLVQETRDTTPVFWILSGIGVVSLGLISFALPATPRRTYQAVPNIEWRALRSTSVLAVLLLSCLLMCAYNTFVVMQSAWVKVGFQADEGQLGQLFAMVGVAELMGSGGVALLADLLGKRRAVFISLLLTASCMVVLPLSGGDWTLFLALFFCFYLFQEFAIVATMTLVSGVAPHVRATVLALAVATAGLGSVIGSQLSEPLWANLGYLTNALVSAALISVALLCLVFVREGELA
jgi:predicted MFS family arabinose efflux permease